MNSPQQLYSNKIREDPVFFAEKILGLPLHLGQQAWFKGSTRKINILRPGNRWGKTMAEAIKHIWQGMTKPQLAGKVLSEREWLDQPYETLNFGPGYEQAREVPRLVKDIVEGKILFPKHMHKEWGRSNRSQLKGWAIMSDRVDAQMLPSLQFITGAKLLIRSYSEMGAAFKAKSIAFISGDECADIQELWTFTNITLLPRLVSLGGVLDFAGTPQPEGHDYMRMIEMAQEDMEKGGDSFYTQKGTMYDNTFLDPAEIKKTEDIADPMLRRQIIEGEYVESGDKYFGFERISNAVDDSLTWLDRGLDGRKYFISVDFAGGKSVWADFTVILVIDYTEEPYRLVHFFRIQGNKMPIPMQYLKVEEIKEKFPGKLIIDGSALGGKNASAFLRHLKQISMDITARTKSEMMTSLKTAFDGGQSTKMKRKIDYVDDVLIDKNPFWGLIRMPNEPIMISELQNYRLDDKKLRNDIVVTLAQLIYWIEMRRPKQVHNKMYAYDFNSII